MTGVKLLLLHYNTIPSGQLHYSKFEYLNIPDKVLNVNNFTKQISEEVLLKILGEFLIHINALNRMEINVLS